MPAVNIPVVWSEDCLRHEPAGEVRLGVREPGTGVPRRAGVLLAALRAAGAPVLPARPHDDQVLSVVHDATLVQHLATIWAHGEAWGYVSEHGRDRVIPYVFPTAGLLAGLAMRSPAAARPGGEVLLRQPARGSGSRLVPHYAGYPQERALGSVPGARRDSHAQDASVRPSYSGIWRARAWPPITRTGGLP